MSNIVKSYSSGKINVAIFQGDYQGKATYQFKFQKSYIGQDKQWKNTDYFGIEDIMNVRALCDMLIQKNIKEKNIKQKNQAQDLQQLQYQQSGKQFLDKHKEDQDLHFDPDEDLDNIPF